MKIYLAGPDVFRPDARDWAVAAKLLCRRHGCEALTPLDHDEQVASRIFAANLVLIDRADIVIANLNPFRGCEPDSGTCFEIGYAHARGKQVFGYLDRKDTLRERVNQVEKADSTRTADNAGMAIEDFDLPLNLMLAIPVQIVEGDLEKCLKTFDRDGEAGTAPAAVSVLPAHPKLRQAIEAAVRYLRWVATGMIADPDAVATVADHYKVRPEIVNAWRLDPAFSSTMQEADYTPEDIIRHMKISGRQYRSFR